ncbi:MAG TPA: hypothetical protein VEM41_08050 [Actinomycetota bacterium]|nr:hypothetical protein [Actinomycetota bacterium]
MSEDESKGTPGGSEPESPESGPPAPEASTDPAPAAAGTVEPSAEPTEPSAGPAEATDPTAAEATEAPPPRRSTGRIVAAVVVAVLVVAAAVGFLLTRNQGTALALSYAPGQTSRFHFATHEDLTLSSGGQSFPVDATVSADMQLRVLSVDSNGTATVRITYSNATATVSGRTQSTTIPPVTAKMTSNGQMTTTSGAPIAGGQLGGPFTGGSSQLSAILPSGSVRVGDTWSKSLSTTIFGSPVTISVHGTFLRKENVGDVDAAVIRTTTTAPMDYTVKLADYAGLFGLKSSQVPPGAEMAFSGHTSGTATTWIDTGQKKMVKTSTTEFVDATATLSGIPGGTGALGIKGTVSLTLTPA